MKRDGLDFSGALQALAQRAGVELKPRTPAQVEQDDNLNHLRQVLETAANYYHHLLKNAPQAGHARAHLAGRGLTDRAVEMFQLGYALESWDAGLKYFTSKGYALADLLDAGLIVAREAEGAGAAVRYFDRFRDRLMIPVRDDQGRMTGFQARALQPEAVPKFMNSPQTALFDKGRTVFGLHLARKAIRDANAAIVVEGNLDVVAAHQAGFTNVVSAQGTALTEHQLRLLKKHARRLILALDADEAGDAAALRGVMVAREALAREGQVVFDPRGLVRFEGRLGADIRVMTLPPGQDPDDVIRRDPAEWARLVEAAEPVVEYVIRIFTAGRDLDDGKARAEIADAVLPLIDDVADAIERDTYRQKLARVLKVSEATLAARRPAAKPRPRPVAVAAPLAPEAVSPRGQQPEREDEALRLETYCLSRLAREPERLYRLDRDLQALGLDKLAPEDFAGTEHQLLVRALEAALAQVDIEPSDYLRHNLDPAIQTRLEALLDAAERAVGPRVETDDDLLTVALRLRERALAQAGSQLRILAEESQEQGEARPELVLAEIARLATAQGRVHVALRPSSRRSVLAGSPAGKR